jgi:hypothetical protein
MTGYLVPVSKSRRRKRNSGNPQKKSSNSTQARVQGETKAVIDNPEHKIRNVLINEPVAHPPVPHVPPPQPHVQQPHVPQTPIRRSPLRGKFLVGGSLLAAGGGGGAYLYQRNRAEKRLSSMRSVS